MGKKGIKKAGRKRKLREGFLLFPRKESGLGKRKTFL